MMAQSVPYSSCRTVTGFPHEDTRSHTQQGSLTVHHNDSSLFITRKRVSGKVFILVTFPLSRLRTRRPRGWSGGLGGAGVGQMEAAEGQAGEAGTLGLTLRKYVVISV